MGESGISCLAYSCAQLSNSRLLFSFSFSMGRSPRDMQAHDGGTKLDNYERPSKGTPILTAAMKQALRCYFCAVATECLT